MNNEVPGLTPAENVLLRAFVRRIPKEDVVRVVLFGSRARGDSHEYSDIDVAVFLRTPPSRRREMRHKMADLASVVEREMNWEGFHLSAIPVLIEDRNSPAFLWEIERDGVVLWSTKHE